MNIKCCLFLIHTVDPFCQSSLKRNYSPKSKLKENPALSMYFICLLTVKHDSESNLTTCCTNFSYFYGMPLLKYEMYAWSSVWDELS